MLLDQHPSLLPFSLPLPTTNAYDVCTGDLDRDGYVDLVFAETTNGTSSSRTTQSHIYWGSASGYSIGASTPLTTIGASECDIGDYDGDGYDDIVFASVGDDDAGAQGSETTSRVFWGSAGRSFADTARTDLATHASNGVRSADLDGDGVLDLLFSSYEDALGGYNTEALVFTDGQTRFATGMPDELPIWGNLYATTSDLDGDGHLDVVLGSFIDGDRATESMVYYGSASGFSRSIALESLGAFRVEAADLDGNGYEDIVVLNFSDGSSYDINSYIYWGDNTGYSASRRAEVAVNGPRGLAIADLNDDGHPDLVIGSHTSDITAQTGDTSNQRSMIYLGPTFTTGWALPTLQVTAPPIVVGAP